MSTEIRQLVTDCLADDDPLAMMRLVGRFRGRVFALCYRMLGQWQDAEDVVQETFVRVSRNLARWDSTREFEPWLLTIAANRCRTHLAKRKLRPCTEPMYDGWATDQRDTEQQKAAQLNEELDRILTNLRPDWREAFESFHQRQLSYEQIASEMNRPVGTIKTWVHRGRQEIIRQLQHRDAIQG
ncbi:MAG: RNA polymerase sigma factor [Pirellulaceae bacterium]|nr:RNA polymerase sigma factor [Pirellulaceae bacterium]